MPNFVKARDGWTNLDRTDSIIERADGFYCYRYSGANNHPILIGIVQLPGFDPVAASQPIIPASFNDQALIVFIPSSAAAGRPTHFNMGGRYLPIVGWRIEKRPGIAFPIFPEALLENEVALISSPQGQCFVPGGPAFDSKSEALNHFVSAAQQAWDREHERKPKAPLLSDDGH